MSRTIKGTKGPGFEYWSRRKKKDYGWIGRASKRWTHARERREAKLELRQKD